MLTIRVINIKETVWLLYAPDLMRPKEADGMASSADPDYTALRADSSTSA